MYYFIANYIKNYLFFNKKTVFKFIRSYFKTMCRKISDKLPIISNKII